MDADNLIESLLDMRRNADEHRIRVILMDCIRLALASSIERMQKWTEGHLSTTYLKPFSECSETVASIHVMDDEVCANDVVLRVAHTYFNSI